MTAPTARATGSRGRPAAAGLLLLATATIALFFLSRGKWADAIVDSGDEWLYADALSRGALLYRDVVYWFGPFTPYFQSAFFRLFGSSFSTLALAGAAGASGVLAALYFALRRVTDRRAACLWTALAIPALVFMPNSGGAILGMGYRIWHPAGFALVAGGLVARPGRGRRMAGSLGAGLCAGLAGLCRTEWGVLTLVSVLAAVWARHGRADGFLREAVPIVAAAALTFGTILAGFAAAAGPAALLRTAPVLLVGIPKETPAGSLFSGLRGWRGGLPVLLYSASLWVGVVSLAGVLAARGASPERTVVWLRRLLGALAGIGILAASGVGSGAVLFGAAPLLCLAAFLAGVARPRGSRAASLVAFGLLGLLSSHRRFFHIGDAGYVAPPLLFAFVCAAGLVRMAVVGERQRRVRLRLRAIHGGALALLVALAFLGRGIQYASDERVPVPGTGGMLSALPETAHRLAIVAAAVRAATGERDGLVVFPEGGVLNYLARRPNPIRHKLYIPGYVTDGNEGEIVSELEAARPGAVVIWQRTTSEYGRSLFGMDYGKDLRLWINRYYVPRSFGSAGEPQGGVLLAVRR